MRNQRTVLDCFNIPARAVMFLVLASAINAQTAATPDSSAVTAERAFFKQYCVTCHNSKLRTADLALDALDLNDLQHSGETLEKVVRKVWSGSMPPAQAPRPSKAVVNTFLTSLETSLDLNAAAHPNPGRPTMFHRLNRTEYINAVRDLFGVDLTPDDTAMLPADDLSYGFDNNGDVLGVPPLLLERYLSVARRVSVEALGPKPHAEPAVFTHTTDYGPSQATWKEGMPLGTRGGTAFTYRFSADGEYSIKIRLQRRNSRIVGFVNAAQSDDTTPRERIVVGVDGKTSALFLIGPDITARETLPGSSEGLADLPQPPVKQLSRADATNRGFNADDDLEFKFNAKAGDRRVTVAFLARYAPVSSQLQQPYAAGQGGDPRPMGIYSVTVTGPFNPTGPGETPSRRLILTCHPSKPTEEAGCERNIILSLARRAYRRPVSRAESQDLLTAYEVGRGGGDFETGFGMAMRRMLMDPAFLFRAEHDPAKIAPDTPYHITDLELASRLSFFLWSTAPDEELLSMAEKGQLKDPAVLEHQVRRMLKDQRAQSLVNNFASEWLGVRVVGGAQPDPVLFSDFDGLKEAFQRETQMVLNYVLLGDRSVLELLNSDYTFVNERLAGHYGIPNVYGDQFRKVAVTDGIRGGLLGEGGVLTATSYPNRTSPVLRGKWVLDNILGSPPAPPPPNVPPLADEEPGKVLSMRERMAEHRKNLACASCHARMDPIGFALENFDATGRWRAGESSGLADLTMQPIDATGQLVDGTKFDGIKGLKAVLHDHSEEFVYNMTERLLTYALGRGPEWYDAPVIRSAVRAAKKDDYRFSSVVLSLIKSAPFEMRMSRDAHEVEASPEVPGSKTNPAH
jgi:Protein of unknown function (DUF1592)/Protein of unknown function (DUF1588)/Protein of unknown function (DUF1585)/Protein of unknown function (DUF1587)/Protein of unknown function (DUF1595)